MPVLTQLVQPSHHSVFTTNEVQERVDVGVVHVVVHAVDEQCSVGLMDIVVRAQLVLVLQDFSLHFLIYLKNDKFRVSINYNYLNVRTELCQTIKMQPDFPET